VERGGGGFKGEKNMKAGLFYGQLKKIHTIDGLTCNQKSKLPKLRHNKILKDFERNIMLFFEGSLLNCRNFIQGLNYLNTPISYS